MTAHTPDMSDVSLCFNRGKSIDFSYKERIHIEVSLEKGITYHDSVGYNSQFSHHQWLVLCDIIEYALNELKTTTN